jgi:threonine dehydrogenase-like Zn-dependent dehydrogenase
MIEKQIFIFGAGYSGMAFARANKDAATIFGTTRSPGKFATLRQAGVEPLCFDGALTPGPEPRASCSVSARCQGGATAPMTLDMRTPRPDRTPG